MLYIVGSYGATLNLGAGLEVGIGVCGAAVLLELTCAPLFATHAAIVSKAATIPTATNA
jgi:hypothetical protein